MLDPGLVARKQEETLPAVARVGYGRREALVGFTQEKAQGPSMSKKDANKRPGRMKAKGPLGWGEDGCSVAQCVFKASTRTRTERWLGEGFLQFLVVVNLGPWLDMCKVTLYVAISRSSANGLQTHSIVHARRRFPGAAAGCARKHSEFP